MLLRMSSVWVVVLPSFPGAFPFPLVGEGGASPFLAVAPRASFPFLSEALDALAAAPEDVDTRIGLSCLTRLL